MTSGPLIALFRIIELAIATICPIAIVRVFRSRDTARIAVVVGASVLIIAGEYHNAFITDTVHYNDRYLLWFPGRRLPVCIVFSGILFAIGVFQLITHVLGKCRFGTTWRIALGVCFTSLLCLSAPAIERFSILLGLWEWREPQPLTLGWCVGVYRYYFCYLFLAIIPGIVIREMVAKGPADTTTPGSSP